MAGHSPQGPQQWGHHQAQPYGYPPQAPKSGKGIVVLVVVACLAVPLLGMLAAVGIYGVRRYLASAKTSEAKNTAGAIARAAAAAYEAEQPDGTHRLCASSGADALGHGPVPSTVPSGNKYVPDPTAGRDFETGTDDGGWRCLKFSMSQPIYYQYHYNVGTGFLSPALTPSPDSFEAAAVGDLDGDSTTSLFSRTGSVDSTGQLQVSTQIYVQDQFE